MKQSQLKFDRKQRRLPLDPISNRVYSEDLTKKQPFGFGNSIENKRITFRELLDGQPYSPCATIPICSPSSFHHIAGKLFDSLGYSVV
jgi:hypothetical protein